MLGAVQHQPMESNLQPAKGLMQVQDVELEKGEWFHRQMLYSRGSHRFEALDQARSTGARTA
jgi:hypothetical protein